MGGRDGDLEVLVPLGDEGAAPPDVISAIDHPVGRRRRRWPVIAVVALLIAIAVGLPLRERIARSEFRWLDRRWAESTADDSGQEMAVQQLMAYLPVSDGPEDVAFVNAAIADVYREEQQRLDSLRARLHRAILVDSRVRAIRSAMVTELAHRATLLAGLADWYGTTPPTGTAPPFDVDDETVDDIVRVERDLATAQAHWNEPAAPPAAAAPYTGVTKPLAGFSRFSPDGSRLVVSVGQASFQDNEFPLLLVNLASGRETTIPTEPDYSEESFAWTADGTRLFWIYDVGNESILATWKLGDSQSNILRVPDLDLTPPLLVVP